MILNGYSSPVQRNTTFEELQTDGDTKAQRYAQKVVMVRDSIDQVRITVGTEQFTARWERDLSPNTCAAFEALLPFSQKIIHARWSGEACWRSGRTYRQSVSNDR
jgi:hypothetical protein